MLSETAEKDLEEAILEVMRRHFIPGVIVECYGASNRGSLRLTLNPSSDVLPRTIRKKICPRCLAEEVDD